MEGTPVASQNTDCYFTPAVHPSVFQSTPAETPKLIKNQRKRKATDLEDCEVTCPETPPFSSTLNESLFNHFENFHLDHGESTIFEETPTDQEISRSSNKRFCSLPNTPDKQEIKSIRAASSTAAKNFVSQSPLNKDAYDILYPSIPCLDPARRQFVTPQKVNASYIKRCLFSQHNKDPFTSVLSNAVVMRQILKYLSNGDLYRLSQTSKHFKEAIIVNRDAKTRYYNYLQMHKLLKENYKITPPSSPEKDSGYEDASPGSKNHMYFREIASCLNKNQSLIKCPRCNKASVVENHIAQCQNLNQCGYIFCQKCNSFSNDPEEFKDHCRHAQLNVPKPRNLLSDLSNCTTSDYATDSSTSFFTSSLTSSKYESSGFYSDVEVTPKRTVKTKMLSSNEIKILAVSNANIGKESVKSKRRTSLLPVVPLDTKKSVEIVEPSSPPKIKQPAVCSKQSKRNLKRLTR
ncbi:unnamed protein product [Acanthoscelides obtectus]|uniref:F-box domain-containing protein n=1 Tax=Acanthoscelides obtectus TaxID=200917 RepID=A0A9P0Q6F3_ACAOB|nr:unnamed protein product [Acanthoscelides obtectus]CAK1659220.1 hypothetical protein AOBTE_LOCUS21352 [Acanthoscelides obtectus]